MEDDRKDESAFPGPRNFQGPGLTKRELFAVILLAGLVAAPADDASTYADDVNVAVNLADLLLERLP